jgi:hypothetical protein
MPELLALLRFYFKNRKATYLGYSARGYYNIRQFILRGDTLNRRLEDRLSLKASLRTSTKNKEPYCDCPYTTHTQKSRTSPVQSRPEEDSGTVGGRI